MTSLRKKEVRQKVWAQIALEFLKLNIHQAVFA